MEKEITKLCKCGCGREIPTKLQYSTGCYDEVQRKRMVIYNRKYRANRRDIEKNILIGLRTKMIIKRTLLSLDITTKEVAAQVEKIRLRCGVPSNFIQI